MRIQILVCASVAGVFLAGCAGPSDVQVDDAREAPAPAAASSQQDESERRDDARLPSQDRLNTAAREAIEKDFSMAQHGSFESPVGDVASVSFSRVVGGREVIVMITQSVPGEDGWRTLLSDVGAEEEHLPSGFRIAVVERDDLVQVAVLDPDGVLTNAHAGTLRHREGQPLPVSRQRLVEIARQIAEATR